MHYPNRLDKQQPINEARTRTWAPICRVQTCLLLIALSQGQYACRGSSASRCATQQMDTSTLIVSYVAVTGLFAPKLTEKKLSETGLFQ